MPDADVAAVLVRPCPDPKFGDYQTNALMSLAKARKLNPRQLAADVVAKLQVGDCCEQGRDRRRWLPQFPAQTRGARPNPGGRRARRTPLLRAGRRSRARWWWISVRPTSPSRCTSAISARPSWAIPWRARCACSATGSSRTITSATGARSSACCSSAGRRCSTRATLQTDPLAEMERLYKTISAQCDAEKPGFDQATLDRARSELVKLQAGDAENLAIWREMIRAVASPVRHHLWPAGGEVRPHPGRELLPSSPCRPWWTN